MKYVSVEVASTAVVAVVVPDAAALAGVIEVSEPNGAFAGVVADADAARTAEAARADEEAVEPAAACAVNPVADALLVVAASLLAHYALQVVHFLTVGPQSLLYPTPTAASVAVPVE